MAKLKFGLVGGGHGAFIGQVHRMAAELDGLAELVCGAFSSDPVQSRSAGVDIYHLPASRAYPHLVRCCKQSNSCPQVSAWILW